MKSLKNEKKIPKGKLFLTSFILLLLIGFTVGQGTNSPIVNLASDIKDYFTEVSRGNVGGQESILKFGFNPDVGTSKEDIWTSGGILVFQTTAAKYNISSGSGSDTIAGSNARTIILQGLDADFLEIEESVNLSGVTVVQTTQEFIRLNRAFVGEVGTYGVSNAGLITISTSDTGNTQGGILLGEGQTQKSHYTVPSGKTAVLKRTSVSVDTTKIATIQMWNRRNANNTVSDISPVRIFHQVDGVTGAEEENYLANLNFPEKTDLWMTSTLTQASGGVEVDYDIILFDN